MLCIAKFSLDLKLIYIQYRESALENIVSQNYLGGTSENAKEVLKKMSFMTLLWTIYRGRKPNWLITKTFLREKW